jgi:trehalose-phosphatase
MSTNHGTSAARGLDAVLFDMDGVVTDTAEAHAATWKRLFDEFLRRRAEARGEEFRPFDADREYRELVDGKPRHDGIRSVLRDRGIDLPEGAPDDPPDAETVQGLGRRKQDYFRAWLAENRVRTYPGTQALIRDLRREGVRLAVFSSSRNAEDVLRNAGALELFDTKVDGRDLAAHGLRGKPDPAMLLEAAARLGAEPARTAVVEDSVAGVEAGVRGGFALVIGVDRGGNADALTEAGAQLVVGDLAELSLRDGTLALKTLHDVPDLRDREADLHAWVAGRRLAVFLDYDGTLTPIVEDHGKAFMADDMRAAVAALADHCAVAVISGRDLAMLRRLVALDTVYLAGSHGFEIASPDDSIEPFEKGREFLAELDAVERELRERLARIEGHSVERKRFSVAVHFRQVADADVGRLTEIVDATLAEHPRLKKGFGKKVYELRPGIDWNKGHAVLWLLKQLAETHSDIAPVYVGDDITDEDAFRALSGVGLTIVVRDVETRPTAADCSVADVAEVRRLLGILAELTSPDATAGDAR